MKNLILLTFFLIFTFTTANAAELKIEPVYSVETTQRQLPKPAKTVVNNYLGIRALYGVPLISAELEVAQAFRTERFNDTGEKVDYTTQRAMLGIRSYPIKSQYVGIYFRAGARARKEIRETTASDGTTEKDESDIQFDPYAGAGFTLAFGSTFALNAGATLVYNKEADSSQQYDAVYTFGFTFKAGNR
tara:strand:- start:30630 stop:31196 length:567 start_codon:yes stop_codon:yes gene_type:complete